MHACTLGLTLEHIKVYFPNSLCRCKRCQQLCRSDEWWLMDRR